MALGQKAPGYSGPWRNSCSTLENGKQDGWESVGLTPIKMNCMPGLVAQVYNPIF